MIYEIREICGDYGLYVNGEFALLVNYRKNAEKIKEILEADGLQIYKEQKKKEE